MGEQKAVRLFVSCAMPESVQREIVRFEQALKKSGLCQGTYVNPAYAHLTLAFLGEVEADDVSTVDEALQSVIFRPCLAKLSAIEWFEYRGDIKIIYMGIACLPLLKLARSVQEALNSWLPREERKFVSHVTVVRVKKVPDPAKLREFMTQYRVEPVSFDISGFTLVQSGLTAQGAVHTMLKRYELQK